MRLFFFVCLVRTNRSTNAAYKAELVGEVNLQAKQDNWRFTLLWKINLCHWALIKTSSSYYGVGEWKWAAFIALVMSTFRAEIMGRKKTYQAA